MRQISLCIMLLLLLSACSIDMLAGRTLTPCTIQVSIPLPENPADSIDTIVWVDKDDMIQTISPLDMTSFQVELPCQYVTPILINYKNQDHPMGCIYPISTSCTAIGGWSAHLLYQFLRKTEGENIREYASRFNWKKLQETAEKCEDPWILDEEAILSAIADGTFEKSLVTRPKSR